MSRANPFRYISVTLVSLTLLACSASRSDYLTQDAEHLETTGDLAKYHYLVREPYSVGLSHEGFLIGIEKSPKNKIRYPKKHKNTDEKFKDIDEERFQQWPSSDPAEELKYRAARNDHFKRVMRGTKGMYVSHILSYGPDRRGTRHFEVCPEYLAFTGSGFAAPADKIICSANGKIQAADARTTKNYYDDSWSALDRLEDTIYDKIKDAKPKYSHIVVASMGWNNDQVESVRRYNALLGNIIARARLSGSSAGIKFNPYTIGLTWPSVWGGDSFFNTLNLFNHLVSYPNKADDADEIGYTIANYLVNKIVFRLKEKLKRNKNHDIKVVLIGHSLGARILSRAMFSARLLNESENPKGDATDLFIGLQGAFSVRRFKKDHELPFPASLFRTGEGSPYLFYDKLPGHVVLTSSKYDAANPIAQWFTGAAHAGSKAGFEESKEISGVFNHLVWDSKDKQSRKDLFREKGERNTPEACAQLNPDNQKKKVLMINADKIVLDHNDILDPEMGRLIWRNILCFTQ